MLSTKQKVDRLERIFGQYMSQTNDVIIDMKAMMQRLEDMSADMKRQAELDRQQAEENRERDWQQAEQNLERIWQKAEQNRERDRLQSEQNRKQDIKEWNKRWGELANRLGTVVEDIVAPNLPRIAKEYFQCGEIDDVMVRRWIRSKKDRSKRREFDVIVVAGETVILNETKSTATVEYINHFLDVLPEVLDYFPEYQGKTIIPVFASLYMREDLIAYLTKHQVYAMTMGDETMELVNFQELTTQAHVS